MPSQYGIETCLQDAGRTAFRLASDDEGYRKALSTGVIPSEVSTLVVACFERLFFAIKEITNEISTQADLPVKLETYRLLSSTLTNTVDTSGQSLIAELHKVSPMLAREIKQLLVISSADGWLRRLSHLEEFPEKLNLRREIGFASFAPAADGVSELSLKASSGESIPMTAPILMDESVTTKGSGQAYYLAIHSDAIEVISFIDRCTRGIDQLSVQVRALLGQRNC